MRCRQKKGLRALTQTHSFSRMPDILSLGSYPKGLRTQIIWFQGPNTMKIVVKTPLFESYIPSYSPHVSYIPIYPLYSPFKGTLQFGSLDP